MMDRRRNEELAKWRKKKRGTDNMGERELNLMPA
jgi:hypothetical protein